MGAVKADEAGKELAAGSSLFILRFLNRVT